MRVLLVEDDRMIGDALRRTLRDAQWAVDWVRDAEAAERALGERGHDLLLLDLGLPGCGGADLLRSLRRRGNPIPVVVVTARDAVEDRVAGLDGGADDYMVKPFETAELLARMRAVVRRRGGMAGPLLSNGVLTLDPATREADSGGVPCTLSAREFSLLRALLIRPGAILSRRDLENRVYGPGEEVESNAVEFLIHGLRRKLGGDAIRNVRGVGWRVAKGG